MSMLKLSPAMQEVIDDMRKNYPFGAFRAFSSDYYQPTRGDGPIRFHCRVTSMTLDALEKRGLIAWRPCVDFNNRIGREYFLTETSLSATLR